MIVSGLIDHADEIESPLYIEFHFIAFSIELLQIFGYLMSRELHRDSCVTWRDGGNSMSRPHHTFLPQSENPIIILLCRYQTIHKS